MAAAITGVRVGKGRRCVRKDIKVEEGNDRTAKGVWK